MKISDLLVTAEDCQTGKRIMGYVCGCKSCSTPYPDENIDHTRPVGLLTHPDEEYGNVRVYVDTLELANVEHWISEMIEKPEINKLVIVSDGDGNECGEHFWNGEEWMYKTEYGYGETLDCSSPLDIIQWRYQ